MKFETLKDNKKILLGTVIVFVVILTLIISTSLAKYKVIQSINIASGTINYSPNDITILTYVDDVLANNFPVKGSTKIKNVVCNNNALASFDVDLWKLKISNLTVKGTICSIYFVTTKGDYASTILAGLTKETRSDFTTPYKESTTKTVFSAEDDDGTSYYYAGAATDNWVKFAGYYWRIIRFNGDGSLRLIYEGPTTRNNGVSSSTTQIGTSAFNINDYDNAYVGYMYGDLDYWIDSGRSSTTTSLTMSTSSTYYYSKSYSFDSNTGRYELSGTPTNGTWSNNFIGYYTCKSSLSYMDCETLYYVSGYQSSTQATVYTYEGRIAGTTTYEITHANKNSSTIKTYLDAWYEKNLTNYVSYIDINAGFCGDRTAYLKSGTSSANYVYTSGGGAGKDSYSVYGSYIRLYVNKSPNLKCINSNDLYTISSSNKGNKALTYPIGLITADEIAYAGGYLAGAESLENENSNTSYYLYTGQRYWTMTPSDYSYIYAENMYMEAAGHINYVYAAVYGVVYAHGVRPVINLHKYVTYTGSGTADNPYVVEGAA